MSDYNFSGLSTRSFEQMIQALSTKLIGPNIVIFGDGPDGGREATFEGTIPYPSAANQWNGYGVIQAKFLQRPQATKDQGEWALSQLRSELQAFSDPDKDRKKPEYYIFVTNAVFSAVKDVGAKDKAKATFDEFKRTVPLKDYDIWDYDKLRAFLDNNDEVRKKYAAFITSGDVLNEIMTRIAFDRPDFESTLTNFLEKELLTDQFVNLEQAGHATTNPIPIARVFTDLPTNAESVIEPSEESATSLVPGFIASVVEISKERLNPSVVVTEDSTLQVGTTLGRLVLIGGPGQGKTTVNQFCCQLFRTALLKDRPQHLITPPAKGVVKQIMSFCEQEGIELPLARRFPLRIQLSAFASALASKEQSDITSVLTYLTQLIAKRTNLPILATDFREWLRHYPWLIILDGLDEVPSSTNRQDVLSAIQDFWVDAAQLDADLLVIATTRPQGYNEDFSPRYYEHRWLTPLSNARALHYGKLLANVRYGTDSERCSRIVRRLTRASEHPATARLMRSPLQVTIMATLVERMGTPPQERWQLFKSYYDIIFMREMERDIPPAAILRDYRSDIDAIHNLVGLLLQIESERTGATEAQLAADKFAAVVRARLESEGHEGSELEDLQEKIIDAATNRLVFLVGLQENRVGFEIRSLQEFMAAEALMDGKDEIIRSRLRAIAVIANWRNVFLFAAGKCFAVQQALRDTIVAIAAQLNEDSEDKTCAATLAGSQLCLDLLADGSSRRQPKYGRTFARIAFRILHLPPNEHQRRLAVLYDEQFQEIFREELSKVLDSSVPEHRLGGWVCLFNLIDAGIEWAESLGEKYWNTAQNVRDLFDVMSFVTLRSTPSWFTNKIIEKFTNISPKTLRSTVRGNKTLRRFLEVSDNELLSAISTVYLRRFLEGNEIGIHAASEPSSPSTTSRYLPVRFFNTPLHGNYRQKVQPLKGVPSPSNAWLPVIEAARFLEAPNAASLAATLKSIAANFNVEESKSSSGLPWAVAACLGVCNTPEEINFIAARVENGEFGDFQDWEQAEQRWQTQGLRSSDFEYMTDDRMPFTKSIGTIGFPFSDFTLSLSVADDETLPAHVTGLLEVYRKVSGYRVKSLVGHTLLFAMNVLQRRKKGGTIEISATEFKQIVADAVGGGNRAWASALGTVPLTDPVSSDWIEVFEFVGHLKSISGGLTNESTIAVIHSTFLRNPKLRGVMMLLALASAHADIPPIPLEMINPEQFDDKECRNAATILMLKQNMGRVSPDAALAKPTVALLEDHPELDVTKLHVTESIRPIEEENDFWLALLDELPPSAWKSRRNIMRRFEESLSVRTSGLDQPHSWESLQLPIALRYFFQTDIRPN